MVKQEPEAYSFAQFIRDKTTAWTGVRNFQARNFLKAMKNGDEVLYYHSVSEKAVVGIAAVVKTAYPDPTAKPDEKGDWVCVNLKAVRAFPRAVSLDEIKARPGLKNIPLLRQSRLSVMPLTATEAKIIKGLGES